MERKSVSKSIAGEKYESVAPDGGWGYAVTFSLSIMMTFTIVPISSFALIFGNYFASFTDETYVTTIVTSLFGTVLHISGLLSHFVLMRFSFRQVASLGACLYFVGSLASGFAWSFHYMVFTYGILQGLGVGLIMPSGLSALNAYFDKRKAVMNSIAQAALACTNMVFPAFTRVLMEEYGFRGTQIIFAAVSLHALLGAVLLQPVKLHMKKVKKLDNEDYETLETVSDVSHVPEAELEEEKLIYRVVNLDVVTPSQSNIKLAKSLTSVASFGSMVFPVTAREKRSDCSFSICDILDMALLKDLVYVNIVFGIAICTLSEMNFIAILPLFLFDSGFSKTDVTLAMTVYFAADLATRLLYVIFASLFQFSNRKVFFWNAAVTFVVRLVFPAFSSFSWIITTTAILGCSRCLIQTPMPLVIAEAYSHKFSSALSFYMVITGVSSIILGAIMGFVRTKTQSSAMVFHVLTVCFLFCVVPWAVEMIYKKAKKKLVSKEHTNNQCE